MILGGLDRPTSAPVGRVVSTCRPSDWSDLGRVLDPPARDRGPRVAGEGINPAGPNPDPDDAHPSSEHRRSFPGAGATSRARVDRRQASNQPGDVHRPTHTACPGLEHVHHHGCGELLGAARRTRNP